MYKKAHREPLDTTKNGCESWSMAGQIWPIVGGLAMAAGVVLLNWARQRRRRQWTGDRKRLRGGLSSGSAEASMESPTIALMLARTPSRPRE